MGADRATQDGFVSIQFVAAAGLCLVVLALVANMIVFQYARGVVRAALDEGVRAGSRADASVSHCLERIEEVLADLLGGELGRDVAVTCGVAGGRMVAAAEATFRAWIPGVPDWDLRLEASSVKEAEP
jgi:hypothetical protein